MITGSNEKDQFIIKYEQCPKCGASMPVYRDYTTWCDQCGWNIIPYVGRGESTKFENMYEEFGQRFSRKLYSDVVAMGSTTKRFTLSKFLAYIMAAIIHMISIVFLLAGLVIIITAGKGYFLYLIGAFLLGMAWISTPKIPKLRGKIAKRDELNGLYNLADEIAQAMGTKNVDGIVIDENFNAAFSRVGVRGKHIMYIGLPLFDILNDEERIALISHELAHGLNGDCTRNIFIMTAWNTLYSWYETMAPGYSATRRVRSRNSVFTTVSLLTAVSNGIMYIISKFLWWVAWLMLQLIWPSQQEAEYLADRIGASVSGTDAYISMLEKVHYYDAYLMAVQQTALSGGKTSLFSTLKDNIEKMPERELERLKRVGELENSRLDTTHPPTIFRMRYIQQFRSNGCKIDIQSSMKKDMDNDMAKFQEHIQYKLIDSYKSEIY